MILMIKKIALILFLLGVSIQLNAQDTAYILQSENFDQTLFRKLNGHRTGFLDLTVPISEKPVPFALLITPLSLYVSSRFTDNYYDENSAALLGTSNALTVAATLLTKETVRRKRPMLSMDNIYFDKDFFKRNDRFSFPSGHASISFSIATSLTLRYPDNPYLITGLYLRALVVSFGRIYIGAHYPADVLVGALIGTGSAFLVNSLRKDIIKFKADIFNQEERKEIGSDKVNQFVLLGSMIALDLVNTFIFGTQSKISKNMHIDFGSVGGANTFKFTYSF